MPLAVQALLPLAVLLAAAFTVRLRGRAPRNGWIAAGSTGLAALIALIELIRLAPGEHVDVPYVTTFPYADLLIRLDGLSLAFVTVTLATAALLMLVRQQDRRDRRDPWTGWLLTSAAVGALMLAGNLLLLYVLLQVLTLAWSGAVDERAPRRRGLRLTLQIADIGLLLAAASAIQSVGTSSFSGVPSDTFGVATFWLMLLPAVVRLGALASAVRQPMAAALFGPAIAWLAPAGYVLLRLLALMGGRLPDRPTAVLLFLGGVGAALALGAIAVWTGPSARQASLLLAAQAALALALSSPGEPLATIASTWLWLLLIPLVGLLSVRPDPRGAGLTRLQLTMLPGTIAFTGIWLGALTLHARGLALGIVPLGVAVLLAALAALPRLALPRPLAWSSSLGWAAALLLIAAVPWPVMDVLVIPAASTARPVPAGTVTATPIGLQTIAGQWPALPVSVLLVGALWLAGRFLPTVSGAAARVQRRLRRRLAIRLPSFAPPTDGALPGMLGGWWSRAMIWGGFGIVLLIALARP
jgi:hypothetical protein